MAQQDIIIGAQDAGNGDNLFQAFTKVQANFNELYSDDLADVNSIIEGTGISVDQATGDVTISLSDGAINEIKLEAINTPSDDMVLTYDSATGGFEWRYDYQSSPDNSTIQFNGSSELEVKDDGVTHDKLEARYTEIQDIATTSGTIALDASSYAAFNLTGTLATATLDIQNIKTGQVIDIILSGSLASAVITLSASTFTTVAINKVGSTSLDTAATNILQVLCVDDTDADAILTWAVASYATGTSV